jgi:hypothetical protein
MFDPGLIVFILFVVVVLAVRLWMGPPWNTRGAHFGSSDGGSGAGHGGDCGGGDGGGCGGDGGGGH